MATSCRSYRLLIFCAVAACSVYFFLDVNDFRSTLATSWDIALFIDAGRPTTQTKSSNGEFSDEVLPSQVPVTQGTRPVDYANEEMLGLNISTTTLQADAMSSVKPEPQAAKAELRIGITESGGSHDEVTAALVHAFGKLEHAEISTYLLLQRYGISAIINSFNLTNPIARNLSSSDFKPAAKDFDPPQILVSVTCEEDIVRLADAFEMLLERGKTFLFCVIHHADRWVEGKLVEKVQPWVKKGLVRFLGLSASVAGYLEREAISKWPYNATVLVNYLPPVFPVFGREPSTDQRPLTFALQGDFESVRRNYTAVFSQLEEVAKLVKNRTETNDSPTKQSVNLHLLGHGEVPTIPAGLESYISIDKSLDYTPYYALLGRTFIVLTSFATPDYLDRKASSSVPASLIAGAPIAATAEILDAYSYLTGDAVWLQNSHESEMDVVKRVIQLSDEERARKKAVVRRVCEKLVQMNVETVDGWVENALAKLNKASGRI